jgi:DNA-binding MarR family transcriptional regulator
MKIEEVVKSTTEYPIEKKTVLNIMYTQNVLAETFNEVLKPYDLSPEQFNVLRILRGQKGKPINMGDIQERMIAKTSNTTRLVDKLLLKDLVTREICSSNRRKMEILITKKGLEVLEKLDPSIVEHESRYAANLSKEELEQLNLLLEKFRTLTK